MAYTVKQLAGMSGVSVRTLHFYDEVGVLKPAYLGANRYRFYEEAQLLTLQQILFYRELGFELKQIGKILGRPDFDKIAALKSHRKVLQSGSDIRRSNFGSPSPAVNNRGCFRVLGWRSAPVSGSAGSESDRSYTCLMRNPAPASEGQKCVGVIRSSSGASSVARRRFAAHADSPLRLDFEI